MRRLAGVVFVGAVATALLTTLAHGAALSATSGGYDLGAQILLRLFGETSDAQASLAASYGDRTSESPLRDLALDTVVQPPATLAGAIDLATIPTFASVRAAERLASAQYRRLRFAPAAPLRYAAPALPPSATGLGRHRRHSRRCVRTGYTGSRRFTRTRRVLVRSAGSDLG